MLCLKIAGCVANSVDPDQLLHSMASYLGLHCLLRPVCQNTYDKYSTYKFITSTAREARREQTELYAREYDQGKVTYNNIYFQNDHIFFLFLPGSCHRKMAELTGEDLIIAQFTKFGSHQ